MNMEACYIYKDIVDGEKITYKNRDLSKLFSATIPYSLETLRISKMFPNAFYTINKKQYTREIINLTFNKHYTKWDEVKHKKKVIASKKKIRRYLYNNGFIMDGIKYVFYKRGAGKAKNGYALYIQENMRDRLINRSRLNLKFNKNEEIDLTSMLAYESLITSGLDFTIELDPKTEILLIDDIYGAGFDSKASVTRQVSNEIATNNENLRISNCLTDGQGLLDESVFQKYSKDYKGFMLLRNDMFKCCAFNTKLQEWFAYKHITTVFDMFGNSYDASKIKLVTTPNSLKFLKFAYKIGSKKECYNYWKSNIDCVFGVVKCDKEGNYGNYNRTTYQVLNSIPNLTYEDLMEITKTEREYVMLLKNDTAVFKNHLGCNAKTSLKLERNMEEGDVSLYENTDLMSTLLLVNSDIQYTKKFKKMKSDLIANYIEHLKEGKIRMKDAKYVTIFSNPYEMLLASINEYDGVSIMHGREVYCKYYKDGQTFCATRNPHINAGNIMHTTNRYHKEYSSWFNFTDNMCAINFFDNDAPDRLQGCDTDSDTILLNPNPILSKKALFCEKNFCTPINRVKGTATPRRYNMDELYKLDATLSNNYIGRIVNLSQIINSYMNDAISKNEDPAIIDTLYQASSRLSSLSQIEIDRSKKVFDNVNMAKELKKIRDIKYIRYVTEEDKHGQLAKKMIVPKFFYMISESNDYRVFEKFNTPMDILQDIMTFKGGIRQKENKHLELVDLLVQSKSLDGIYQVNSANAIYKIVEKCGRKLNGLKVKTCPLNAKGKMTVKKRAKKEAVEKIKKLHPNEATILSVLKQALGNKDNDKIGFKKYGMLTLNLLFIAKKPQILKCFKNSNTFIDEVLIKTNDKYSYNIFGEKYLKISKYDLLQN